MLITITASVDLLVHYLRRFLIVALYKCFHPVQTFFAVYPSGTVVYTDVMFCRFDENSFLVLIEMVVQCLCLMVYQV